MARQPRTKTNSELASVWAHPAEEHEADFKDLMLWMADEGRRAFQERRNGDALYACVDNYINRAAWYLINEQVLEQFLKDGELHPDDGKRVPCIVLKPIEEFHILPVLVPKFVFRREHDGRRIEVYPEIRLRVALFYEDAKKSVRVLGYRFEVPEGAPKDKTSPDVGMHDYSHFQYITGFRKNDTFNELAAELPPHAPAWPVRASGPVSMLATVYVGLYGKRAVFNCPENIGKLLNGFAAGMIRSPDRMYYKIERCQKARLRSEYIVMWDRQKAFVECYLRKKFNVADKDAVLTLVECTKVLLDSNPYVVFWDLRDLP